MAITTHGVARPVGLAQLRIFERGGRRPGAGRHRSCRLVSRPRPLSWPSWIAGANLQFDFLGHRFGIEEAREPRLVEHHRRAAGTRTTRQQLLLTQDVCHNRQLKAHGGFGYIYLQQHFLPTLRTAAVGEGEIETDDDRQPAPHPDDPLAAVSAARDPVADLRRIAFLLEAASEPAYRVRAFRNAAATRRGAAAPTSSPSAREHGDAARA